MVRPALLSTHWLHTLTAMMNVASNGLNSASAAKLVQYDSDTVAPLGTSGSRTFVAASTTEVMRTARKSRGESKRGEVACQPRIALAPMAVATM